MPLVPDKLNKFEVFRRHTGPQGVVGGEQGVCKALNEITLSSLLSTAMIETFTSHIWPYDLLFLRKSRLSRVELCLEVEVERTTAPAAQPTQPSTSTTITTPAATAEQNREREYRSASNSRVIPS